MDDAERFDAIFRQHRGPLLRFFVQRTGDRALAEDLCATVFYEAWRRRSDVDLATRDPLPWLYGVASNVLRNQRRSLRRQEAAMGRLAPPRPELDVADDIIARLDASHTASRLVERLPAIERDVVDLCLAGELSYTAAALRLGLPIGTVRSRLARARARLALLSSCGAAPAASEPRCRPPAGSTIPARCATERGAVP